jgi:hypothetical protein
MALQQLDAGAVGHAHVEQQHVGLRGSDDGNRLRTILRFGHDANVRRQVEQAAYAAAHQHLVVDQYRADQGATPANGNAMLTA